MRISDWSSDVCSSDLRIFALALPRCRSWQRQKTRRIIMGRKKGMGSAPLATGIALASLANIFAVTPSMAQDSACVAGCASSIDDIIVTATRRDSSVISVPLSVAASDRERLDRDRVTNIADLARP